MTVVSTAALDPIDEFTAIAVRTAEVTASRDGKLAAASAALCDVAQRLLASNRHTASWLSQFTSFDIGGADAAARFRKLRDEFNTAKAGPELHRMKFRCRDLGAIFDREIKPELDRIFPGDLAAQQEIEQVFDRLPGADDDMVDFIHSQLVQVIDRYVADVLPPLQDGRPNVAERRRLAFDRDTAPLMERLIHLGGALSDLVLAFADEAGIDVWDEDGT